MNKPGWFTPGHPAQLVIGFALWSIWFVAMYAGLSVVCQLAPPAEQQGALTWLNAGLFGLTLLVVILLLLLAWRSARFCMLQRSQAASGVSLFIGYISAVLYLLAAIATLAGGLPVLVYSPCS